MLCQSDSVKVHRGNLLRKIAQADSLPAYKMIAYERQRDIDSLTERVINLKLEIEDFKRKDANNIKIITLMEGQKTQLEEQKKIALDQVGKLNRSLRFNRTMRDVVTGGFLLILGKMIYDAVKK